MTVTEVEARVAKIAAEVDDPEVAHGYEDGLRRDVLAAIANGEGDPPAALAKAALKTAELHFPRWYT